MVQIKFPNSEILEAAVANNFLARIKGLSGIKEKSALVFKFPFSAKWAFWMPNMYYPLWLIFIDSNKKIIDIKYALPLTRDIKTWKIYRPKRACKYVLETPFEHKVKEGDILEFEI